MNFTLLDAGFGIILAIFLIRGLLCGLVQELAGLVGIVLGFFAAGRFQGQVLPHMRKLITNQSWAEIASYVAIFLVVFLAVVLIGMVIRKLMKLTLTSWLDYLTGAIIGAIKGILVCTVIFMVIRAIMPSWDMLKESFSAPYLSLVADMLKPYLPSLL